MLLKLLLNKLLLANTFLAFGVFLRTVKQEDRELELEEKGKGNLVE